MAFINVAEWTPDNVNDWLKGLEDCILPYVHFFLNNNINGCRLLLLSSDDLEKLNVKKIGHQEIILDGVDLLKHLHYSFSSETLQSLALRLGCKSRSLYNQLKHDQANGSIERVSTKTLSAVCDILTSVKSFIAWIDTYPFEGNDQYAAVRKSVLKISIELAWTSQRDQFVEKPNDVIMKNSLTLADLCDNILQNLTDPLAIQPATLEVVTIRKKATEEVGMEIHSSYCGVHIVGGVKFQSPASRCGRIEEGDEIVQVNYQTVVGWQLKKLVNQMAQYPTEILLTVKKRPRHSNILGQVTVLKPYKIPSRKTNRNQRNRVRNAATTTANTSDDEDVFEKETKESQLKKPVYPLLLRKQKRPVKRRATINGTSPTPPSPTSGYPTIRTDDLLSQTKKEIVSRSLSHDPCKYEVKPPLDPPPPEVPLEAPKPPPKPPVPTVRKIRTMEKANTPTQVPYAKVQPLSLTERRDSSEKETVPKEIQEDCAPHPCCNCTKKLTIIFNEFRI
ncbi:uncharacterized protein B4U79_03212 [Dinothrombium tinctorium]|uniref:Connector enhancer of kinase suppressor of ras 2-like protein n=1 Tax=Dinothrombium tinctorium TaxID=1965070 RepID=A0A3S3RU65_9ACAR|nr:uncharacterized protein B4U79_01411 [Dinothrombium tinctorium]RWS06082.1 uncharacterized protein B4U79_11770 [Dinothrombium tinctorium]RWS06086.1 uncharacterized protein B4U79_13935 [Dinothrombium tinctorium]RWS06899.1 uncharacterized protein B4U79_03212 [Dinothrombium tinctorium]